MLSVKEVGGGFGACLFVEGRATLSCLLNSRALAIVARFSSKLELVFETVFSTDFFGVIVLERLLLPLSFSSLSSCSSDLLSTCLLASLFVSIFIDSASLSLKDFLMASRASLFLVIGSFRWCVAVVGVVVVNVSVWMLLELMVTTLES